MVRVRPYARSDGTKVRGHTRRSPGRVGVTIAITLTVALGADAGVSASGSLRPAVRQSDKTKGRQGRPVRFTWRFRFGHGSGGHRHTARTFADCGELNSVYA